MLDGSLLRGLNLVDICFCVGLTTQPNLSPCRFLDLSRWCEEPSELCSNDCVCICTSVASSANGMSSDSDSESLPGLVSDSDADSPPLYRRGVMTGSHVSQLRGHLHSMYS